MPNFTTYVPPNVYVDATSSPVIAPVGVAPTVVCLIGSGVGYHTFTEAVSFSAGNSVVLSKKGIDPTSIVVSGFIPDPNATNQSLPYTFVADVTGGSPVTHDYGTSVDTTAGIKNSVTTLNRETTGKIVSPYLTVTVSYHYTDAAYYNLNYFTDFTTFSDTYGPALDPISGALVSPLSLAAQFAMQNGANQVYAIALEGGSGTVQQQFADAYQLLSASNVDVNVVVPLWSGVTVTNTLGGMMATLKSALLADATNGVLRVALVGFDQDYAPATTDLTSLAVTTSSNRIVEIWPNQLTFYNGYTTTTQTTDGFYLAAALSGVLTSQDAEVPLTRKKPTGFTGFPLAISQALTTTVKNTLAQAGICVCEIDRNNQVVVRHGLTTNYAGGVLTREISLVRAQDALYALIDSNLDSAGLIGQPITPTTALQVKSIVSGALETAVASTLIIGYTALAVREQNPPSGDPTIIEVQFAYQPTFPLNYVLVNFTVDTTTGINTLNASLTPITDTSSDSITSA